MNEGFSENVLRAVAARVLEEAAFLFTEPTDDPPPFSGEVMAARLSFSGPRSGSLLLAAPASLCVELAANLLGVEPDDPDAAPRARDALGETLNIIGGTLMAEVFGPHGAYRIGIPEPATVDADGCDVLCGSAGVAAHLVDEGARRIDLLTFFS